MPHCFAKQCRLTHTEQFDTCIQKGRRIKSKPFTCFLRPNQHPQHRLGMIISKRYHKHAAKRNQLKRWLRETFRTLPSQTGQDMVVIPHHNTPITYQHVKQLWKTLNLS